MCVPLESLVAEQRSSSAAEDGKTETMEFGGKLCCSRNIRKRVEM